MNENWSNREEFNPHDDVLVELRAYDNNTQAEIAKSILESAGIFCTLHGEYMSAIYATAIFPVRLMVRECDVNDAIAVLDER